MRKSSQIDTLGGTMNSKNILEHFSELEDPREDNKRHRLIDIITIVLCASICGPIWQPAAA